MIICGGNILQDVEADEGYFSTTLKIAFPFSQVSSDNALPWRHSRVWELAYGVDGSWGKAP